MKTLPQVADPVAARDRILDVATEAFASDGFAGARVDAIAARASINKAMLYYYFGDKERLYAAVLLRTIERGLRLLTDAVATAAKPEERLRAVVGAITDMARENPHFPPMLLREIASGGASLPDEVVGQLRRIFQLVGDVLQQGVDERSFRKVDPVTTHMFIAGSLLVLTAGEPIRRRIRSAGKGSPAFADRNSEEIAEYVSDLLLNGLCPRPASRGRKSAARPRKQGTAK